MKRRLARVPGCLDCTRLDRKLGLVESELTLAARRAIASGRADLAAAAKDAKAVEAAQLAAFRAHLAEAHGGSLGEGATTK